MKRSVFIGFLAAVGIVAAIVGTSGRFLSQPQTEPGAPLTRVISHVVPVEREFPYDPTLAEAITAAGASATATTINADRTLPPEYRKYGNRAIEAQQDVKITVTATVEPMPLRADGDAKVLVTVDTNVAPQLRGELSEETVLLESDSCKIRPLAPLILDLRNGKRVASFVINPVSPGEKMLRLSARHSSGPQYEEIISLRVVGAGSSFLGIDTKVWSVLQAAGTALGFPSLLLLLVTRRLDARRRKAEEKQSDNVPKIILPK